MTIENNLLNNLLGEALKNLNMIAEPEKKVEATTKIMSALAELAKGNLISLEANTEENTEENTKTTREDLINKPNTKAEVVEESKATEQTVAVAASEPVIEDKPENTQTEKEQVIEETPIVTDAAAVAEDVWNEENCKLHMKDYYFVMTFAKHCINSGETWRKWLNDALNAITQGYIKEFVDQNSVPPSLIAYVAASFRQSMGKEKAAAYEMKETNVA